MVWAKIERAADFCQKTWEVARSDRLKLALYGSDVARDSYRSFAKPHRMIPLFQSKGFGAALYRMPDDPSEYLKGSSFELARRKRRKAQSRGLKLEKFAAATHIDDMLQINSSTPNRQGRPVNAVYLDRQAVADFCDQVGEIYGIFDSDQKLKAYAYTPVLGDVFLFSRLLGHAAELEHGIMYLLITEIVAEMLRVKASQGYPTWAMYDMYWGSQSGLREFKRRLGFEPFRVTWTLGDGHE